MFILSDDFAAVRSRFCCFNSLLLYNHASNRIITAPLPTPQIILRIVEWERMGYDENSIGWGGGGKGLIDSVVQMEKWKLVQFLN